MLVIHVARKPFPSGGNVASNAMTYGVAGLHVDACRVPYEEGWDAASNPLFRMQHGYSVIKGAGWWGKGKGAKMLPREEGRWPANVILSCPCFGEPSRYFMRFEP